MGKNMNTSSLSMSAPYFMCMKMGLMGHMQGYAPQVSVEFARKVLPDEYRPSFAELEEITQNLPAPS
jgi:chemotaxis protein MotA